MNTTDLKNYLVIDAGISPKIADSIIEKWKVCDLDEADRELISFLVFSLTPTSFIMQRANLFSNLALRLKD